MIAFSVIWFLLIALVAAPPSIMLRKRQRTTRWDYTYPFTGVAAWFPLAIFGVGSTVSLSNFVIELFWIAVVSIAIPWMRLILSRFNMKQIKMLSVVLTLLPVVVAVVMRLTIPTLPE